jgi:hypothetical protein
MGQLRKRNESEKNIYSTFDCFNGKHPFRDQVPLGSVTYEARKKKNGKLSFFNFDLAREMGLIPADHENIVTRELEIKLLETFSLVIINEYDLLQKRKFPKDEILPYPFMATRYLQLQHPDKKGRTSGDGRTIWNGVFEGKNGLWDISSCGTGATKLSPACNINKKFYETGDPTISYGCGLSEVSEGLETLFFSEVLSKNQIKTERILAIIEFEKGLAINVRAYPNLLRPSHFFCHLKQGNYETLKQVADYYIERELMNNKWEKVKFKNAKEKYYYLASKVASDFARTTAQFEDEYIFCWLDWDGDNILMDGGIIDYGSIRQFGLFHSEYRFDDVERFSTTITEQKDKARYIVQCFIQIADYLSSKTKKNLKSFSNHQILKDFEAEFQKNKNINLLKKIGFRDEQVELIVKEKNRDIEKFRHIFSFFERRQSHRKHYKVADGINKDTIYCMRDLLRELPQILLSGGRMLDSLEFIQIAKSSYAKKTDLKLTSELKSKTINFQKFYLQFIDHVAIKTKMTREKLLLEITMRSSVINKYDRITGDSISFMVDKVMRKKKDLSPADLMTLANNFSLYQNLNPDLRISSQLRNPGSKHKKIINSFLHIVRSCREGL